MAMSQIAHFFEIPLEQVCFDVMKELCDGKLVSIHASREEPKLEPTMKVMDNEVDEGVRLLKVMKLLNVERLGTSRVVVCGGFSFCYIIVGYQ